MFTDRCCTAYIFLKAAKCPISSDLTSPSPAVQQETGQMDVEKVKRSWPAVMMITIEQTN